MESCNSWLCQLLFSGSRYDGRWVLFAQMVWIATRHPRRPFLSFLQTLSECSTVAAEEAGHVCACRSPGNGRARIQGLSSLE